MGSMNATGQQQTRSPYRPPTPTAATPMPPDTYHGGFENYATNPAAAYTGGTVPDIPGAYSPNFGFPAVPQYYGPRTMTGIGGSSSGGSGTQNLGGITNLSNVPAGAPPPMIQQAMQRAQQVNRPPVASTQPLPTGPAVMPSDDTGGSPLQSKLAMLAQSQGAPATQYRQVQGGLPSWFSMFR